MDEQHISSSRDRHSERRLVAGRRGTVLVFFALFLWVAMGIAALVIDQGMARLTQRQLHSAADGVALESMRDRDQARNDDEVDHFFRDRRRRLRANRISAWHFNPTLVTGQSEAASEFRGGGGFIDMTQGTGGMDANAGVGEIGFGVPRPTANYTFDGESATPLNHPWGDVVSGTFLGIPSIGDTHGNVIPQGTVGLDGNPFHLETRKYERVDFEPAAPADAPFADSMVVRLRRTKSRGVEQSDDSSLGQHDYESQQGVSNSGDALPYLFGRGSTMRGDTGGRYAPRRDGQVIRATTIGSSRPAVRVGAPQPDHDNDLSFQDGFNIGVAPFAVTELLWNWDDENFGTIWNTEDDREYFVYVRPSQTGELVVKSDSDFVHAVVLRRPELTRIGDKVTALIPAPETWEEEKNWLIGEGYAPVLGRRFVFGAGWTYRVIGFVRVRAELDTSTIDEITGEPLQRMKLWKLDNDHAENPNAPWIAPRNASALFDGDQVDAVDLADGVAPEDGGWTWEEVFRRLERLPRAVHAPVIVR